MTRGQISNQLNISPETLRYYETLDIISPERDKNNGNRIYSQKEILRLDLIIRFKKFGFSLKEIKAFFDHIEQSKEDKSELNHFLKEKIEYIEKQIEGLEGVKSSLNRFMNKNDVESCAVLSKIMKRA
jgi:DNA-binding transcriptional MerR regulator